jgi:hypothetical protein
MDLLTSLKSKKVSSKERYSLNEILVIVNLKNNGYSYSQIAEVVGRTANSLVYVVRFAKKFNDMSSLFTHFETTYTDEEDVASRIKDYEDSLLAQDIKKAS